MSNSSGLGRLNPSCSVAARCWKAASILVTFDVPDCFESEDRLSWPFLFGDSDLTCVFAVTIATGL